MATAPTVVNVYPANGSQGVVLADRITILFDQEMDESTLDAGNIVLTGPTTDFIFGPDFTPLDQPGVEDEQILNSPYTGAYVEGTFSYERIDNSGLSVVDIDDTTGAGNLYRTRVTFTPNEPLQPGVEYTVLLAGDEDTSDDYDTGVKTRTVFDPVVTASGTGRVSFGGGYYGTTTTTYTVEITTGGATGQAEYIWFDNNDPLTTFPGITTTGRRQIQNGLWIACDPDGSFTVGDTFEVVCVPPEVLEDNYRWTFETGDGSILTPPSTSSASGISDISTSTGTATGTTFTVSSVDPEPRDYNLPITTTEITVTFTEAPEASTVIADNFTLVGEPVNGDSSISSTGDLTFSLSQSGATVTITLDADQLYENNIVKITLSENIQNADGDSLPEYSWYFTTVYNPAYTSIRRIRLDLGPLVANVPNDTIMFAIFEASLYVDAISFADIYSGSEEYFNYARRELATCYAELILLTGAAGLGVGDDMTKRLGDLSVSRGGGELSSGNEEDNLRECIARWEVVVQSGGEVTPQTSQKPGYSVKGAVAADTLGVGRLWEPTSVPGSTRPIGNSHAQATARRWVRNYKKRNA